MNKTLYQLITVGILLFSTTNANSQQLTFNYDNAGNQTKRTWVCINCTGPTGSAPHLTEIPLQVKKMGDSTQFVKRKIIASPNPLVETLKVDWETEEGVSVSNIKVFTIQGNRVHDLSPNSRQRSVSIPFRQLPVGTYILYVTFSDQRKESIKVIKQ